MKNRTRYLTQATQTKAHSIRQSLNRAIFGLVILAFTVPYHVSARERTVEMLPAASQNLNPAHLAPVASARPEGGIFTPSEAEELIGASETLSNKIIPPGYANCE